MIVKGRQNIIKAGTYRMIDTTENEEAKILEDIKNIIVPAQSNVDELLGKIAGDGELSQGQE